MKLPAALILLIPALAGAQTIRTLTESTLGYPVPETQHSLTPIAGFRSYESLRARTLDLSLTYEHLSIHTTGQSIMGESISSFRFSSEDENNREGLPKSGIFIQGTIHAREWASPEATMAIFEWLAEERQSDPIADFLIESMEIVIHPMGNPDGFRQTERYHDQMVAEGNRDGRYRRKNMRGVDTVLTTFDDYLFGTDLNRNHSNGWRSVSSTSITYGGAEPGSEPETQAAYNAAELLNPDRIRLAIDMHSAIPAYYVSRDFTSGYDIAALDCYRVMTQAIEATTGLIVPRIDVDSFNVSFQGDNPVGATDEYFAETYECMSYTAEMRTPSISSGFVFVLPDAEVETLRAENLQAARAGFYYASGPAACVEITINKQDNPVYRELRRVENGNRVRETGPTDALKPGETYTLALRFNKPMRDVTLGAAAALPGAVTTNPQIRLGAIGEAEFLRWESSLYETDTALFALTIPLDAPQSLQPLAITGGDAVGQQIDGDPLTISDWSRLGWTNYEPGPDTATRLSIGESELSLWKLY